METHQWYQTRLGGVLDRQESDALSRLLMQRFGYYIVQLNGHRNLLECSRVKRKFFFHHVPGVPCHALTLETALPIQTDCVDVVVLPHTLESSDDPHAVLREVERILIPEGYVLIMGFNPWSLMGLRQRLSFRVREFPWGAKFYGYSRVVDWLKLLGFEIEATERLFYDWPLQQRTWFSQMHWLDRMRHRFWPFWSGAYILLAKKRVSTLTPIRPTWRSRIVSKEAEVTEVTKQGDLGCSRD